MIRRCHLLAGVSLALGLAVAGCGGEDLTDSVNATITAPEAPEAGPTTQSTSRPRLRDHDDLDLDRLVAEMTADTTGDDDWIEIFAPLRVKSWMASRYPGDYDVEDIYDEAWAEKTAVPNQEDALAKRLYVDQPLPNLVSVEKSRDLGNQVEIEVVIEAEDSIIRSLDDDSVQGSQEGGLARGLFILGQDSGNTWRIHSVVELQVVDQPVTEETTS